MPGLLCPGLSHLSTQDGLPFPACLPAFWLPHPGSAHTSLPLGAVGRGRQHLMMRVRLNYGETELQRDLGKRLPRQPMAVAGKDQAT